MDLNNLFNMPESSQHSLDSVLGPDAILWCLREGLRKKIRNYLGIFPNIGGGSPHSQNFCYPNHSPKNPLKTP